ncbi:hypothetical protein GCM10010371_04650 [Streptomyces subrutilus]|uniref:Secreted protein n=1 Tax=Streptomyces subrutilus TaxID=36818 RepID=A0A5P2UMK8_9ACTN|nr:DUF5719 family protein [Streptomyces subrutilus]QEU80333.1 hypothetical protein CP968_20325 [Streptomyces subrutilus]GGZ48568.1 hypothetical protein GCM10010371_04650 [Streptomyces subrutilus]
MKHRAPLTLAAVTAALAALAALASLTAPAAEGKAADGKTAAAVRMPVERSLLVCPAPSSSDIADTAYTAFTPAAPGGAKTQGTARLLGATAEAKPVLEPKEPGKPFGATASGADAPALNGTADGALAPGWTVQQTTKVSVGRARGLLGAGCTAPGTDFWFPAVSTAKGREDYVHLTNPDDAAAVVDIRLFGPDGALKTDAGAGENIRIDPRSSASVLLSSLAPATQLADATAHVTTRAGRVGASVQVAEDGVGADWLPAAADPTGSPVLPGIPADAASVRLVVFAPGDQDADLALRLAGPGGAISPAGNEQVHVKAGMTASVDLGDLTRGEPGSLLLTPVDAKKAAPVVAALRVVRGAGTKQELGFVPAAGPVGARATAADNRPDENATVLSLTAPAADAKVRVTASPGTGGGEAASQEVALKAGTTQKVTLAPTGGKGPYALTVETLSGGPVHAARTLSLPHDGIAMFTVQTLSDDRSTVSVPRARQDLSVLTR